MLTAEMFLKYRMPAVAGMLFFAGCLTAPMSIVVAQEAPAKVATAQRETLLQTTQSWNGKAYTHYPTGQPQLTTLKVTIAAHTSGTGEEPAVLLITYAGTPGVPTLVPAKGEIAEY